jgi:hypothetical protein
MDDSNTDPNLTLETVQEQFEKWRSNRTEKRDPIPNDLWQAAAALCKNHSIANVSRRLRLSYIELKKRVSPSSPKPAQFMELDLSCLAGEWQLECHRADGAKLKLSAHGQLPAIDLLRQFLS